MLRRCGSDSGLHVWDPKRGIHICATLEGEFTRVILTLKGECTYAQHE